MLQAERRDVGGWCTGVALSCLARGVPWTASRDLLALWDPTGTACAGVGSALGPGGRAGFGNDVAGLAVSRADFERSVDVVSVYEYSWTSSMAFADCKRYL